MSSFTVILLLLSDSFLHLNCFGLNDEISNIIWRSERHLFLFLLCQISYDKVFNLYLPGFSPESSFTKAHPHGLGHAHSAMPK